MPTAASPAARRPAATDRRPRRPAPRMIPWRDPSGRFSWFKTAVFVALFVPGLWLAADYVLGRLGPRPLTEIIHTTGLWAIRLLFVSLLVTPLRHLLQWPKLVAVRRMIGVAAMTYALLHLLGYVADQAFDLRKVAIEIVLRLYLTIGFVGLALLVALGITSTDGMIRRLGGKAWRRLHQATYLIALLAIVHFFMQSKLDVSEATVMAGLFLWLMGYRLLGATVSAQGRPGLVAITLLAIVTGLITAFGEAAYYYFKSGVRFARILNADLQFDIAIRPPWIVLGICLAVSLATAVRLALVRRRTAAARRRNVPPAATAFEKQGA